jgi:hypothetical protein
MGQNANHPNRGVKQMGYVKWFSAPNAAKLAKAVLEAAGTNLATSDATFPQRLVDDDAKKLNIYQGTQLERLERRFVDEETAQSKVRRAFRLLLSLECQP